MQGGALGLRTLCLLLWLALCLEQGSTPALEADPCLRERGGEPLAIAPLLITPDLPPGDPDNDYRHRLQTTPRGWPLQGSWCVWLEPPDSAPPQATSHRWHLAVNRALQEWQGVLPIRLVNDPGRAQVRIHRRRPPLARDATGRTRASHGRAILSLHRPDPARPAVVAPRVEVLISPGQRLEAIQATALHELGHAFGIWGHSEDPGDAMAVAPGAQPVLRLSPRDRATVQWLYRQATPMRSDP